MIMEPYTHEFNDLIADLQSPTAYKKLRPGFITKYNMFHSGVNDLSMVVVKTKSDRIEFELSTLFRDLLYRSEPLKSEFLIPYQYRIDGYFKGGKIIYSSLAVSLRGQGENGIDVETDVKIDKGDPIEHSEIVATLENELNGNYNNLSSEEKTLFTLEGKRAKGKEFIRQLNAIEQTFRTISERSAKRQKVFRVINYLIGQWIQSNEIQGNGPAIIASSIFNGCATYLLSTLYIETLIMIL